MMDFVSYTPAKQWNELSHLQKPFGSAQRSLYNSIPHCRNSLKSEILGKKTPTITMCYSYVHHPFLAWNSYQRMFCDIPWVSSVIISYVLRFCLFKSVKTLCFTMVLCFGTFQRLPWKNQHIKTSIFIASLFTHLPLSCCIVSFPYTAFWFFFQCRWHHKELKICIRTSLFIFGAHPPAHPPALVLSTPSWCVILQMT